MGYLHRRRLRLFSAYVNKLCSSFISTVKSKKTERLEKVSSILVFFYIPIDSPRYNKWDDGFVRAIEILQKSYSIKWCNLADSRPDIDYFEQFDLVLVKSNWNWGPDKYLRSLAFRPDVKFALLISGVSIPPSKKKMLFYNLLFYETEWYKSLISEHPNLHKAFGVVKGLSENGVKFGQVPKKYDYLSIGALLPHKRHHKLLNLQGNRAVLGEFYVGKSEDIKNDLESGGIEILSFVPYSHIPDVMIKAKCIFIPASIEGGGERAVLEARLLGIPVLVTDDNPKLRELLYGEIPTEETYASQINKGIKSLC